MGHCCLMPRCSGDVLHTAGPSKIQRLHCSCSEALIFRAAAVHPGSEMVSYVVEGHSYAPVGLVQGLAEVAPRLHFSLKRSMLHGRT